MSDDVAPARDWVLDLSKHFKVHSSEPVHKDENLNDRIESEGAHWSGGNGELAWYARHKGYSANV